LYLQVVDQSEVCADVNDNILDDLFILSCEDDYAICHRLFKRGFELYYHLLDKWCRCFIVYYCII